MAGLDIILDTTFNNPNLPVVRIPGFLDDFALSDGTEITATSRENRPWRRYTASTSSSWDTRAITNNGSVVGAGTVGTAIYLADAYTPQGTLRMAYSALPGSVSPWVMVRATDARNYIGIGVSTTQINITRYTDNVQTILVAQTGVTVPGSGELTIKLAGATIEVSVQGVVLATAQDEVYRTMASHGIQVFPGGPARIDEIEFIPQT